jgi:hypothetical protein
MIIFPQSIRKKKKEVATRSFVDGGEAKWEPGAHVLSTHVGNGNSGKYKHYTF